MDQLFAPPRTDWQRISPRWQTYSLLGTVIGCVLVSTIPAVLVGVLSDQWWISALIWGVFAVIAVLDLALLRRRWRAWGYAELEDELYITRGVMFRRLTVVPYGRMQVVDVTTGPFERAFGLATVKLVTASASTDATIPGLTADQAARLRDQLTERAEARLSGL
ncbi:PH domain-containing protein [Desertihabitans aurantiacus]|uniref:PH domain-containing protein n=1 Tax=Desertihabitans aurantiacus TaxID=2282477 RepID=UPI001E45F428|nr:PH domain-containing protein [Desertihabitans aurantiacus]